MKTIVSLAFAASICLAAFPCFSQTSSKIENFTDDARGDQGIRIVFYNVENLFDTENDPVKFDDDFTPEGIKNWNSYRMYDKLKKTSKTLLSAGGWEAPALIGLCEIENRFVLEKLVAMPALEPSTYRIAHKESPDRRGIDVALLYRPDKFDLLHEEAIHMSFPFDTAIRTRDILYVKGLVNKGDTLHVFINHWPSRRGGQVASEPRRVHVASVLKARTDSLLTRNPKAAIVIMGDFNDSPENKSIHEILEGRKDKTQPYLKSLMSQKKARKRYAPLQGCMGLSGSVCLVFPPAGRNKRSAQAQRKSLEYFLGRMALTRG